VGSALAALTQQPNQDPGVLSKWPKDHSRQNTSFRP
jgi:hypothetical protein